jgi:DNA polymerase-3 subunit delta'
MAEDFTDPRDTPLHPRRQARLVGHEEAEAHLLQAVRSGKLHHAWLISGPKGIGKATLAYRFGRYMLTPGAADMNVPPEAPNSRLVSAGSHPDLLVVERAIDFKNKKIKSEIAVDDARVASQFFSRTAGSGGYRVCIVDCADDLNAESANALLKIIEEPPAKSLFLITVNRLGSMLPTIRSRCIHLPLKPLTDAETVDVVSGLTEAAPEDIGQAAQLSQGSPGRALQLLDSKGAKAYLAFLAAAKLTPGACVSLGMNFAHRDNGEDFAVFSELLTGWVADEARRQANGRKGLELARAHEEITRSIRQTDALNLDRRQTVVDALLLLGDALKAS